MRKTEIVKVPATWGQRDAGKHFLITEWPAERAEKWAIRALLAYNRGGGELDVEKAYGMGMIGVAILGTQAFLRGKINADEVIPVLDELLECVQMVRDVNARNKETGEPVVSAIVSPDDIAEVQTRMWLRSEVLRIHTGFSPAEALSSLISALMRVKAVSPNIETSPGS